LARREGGEDLYFCENNIGIDFRDRISGLREGDPVFHGVRKCRDGKEFEASAIELYSREEIERMAKGLPAQEPEPKPAPLQVSIGNPFFLRVPI
jgi:hypothetical protein